MVHRKTKSSPLKWFALAAVIAGIVCASLYFIKHQSPEEPPVADTPITEETLTTPVFINLQPTVDAWLGTFSGNAGIVIYDLDNEQIAASHNADTNFRTASLYKLFVVYTGYLAVEQGKIDPNAPLTSGYTISDCLDLAIRESNSTCAEALKNVLSAEEIDNTTYNLVSTPNKIYDIMRKFYNHSDFSETTWATIQDSMLNQPATPNGFCDGPCNWRQGLPSGFKTAKVYDKVGWEHSGSGNVWNLYHDAAIVEFPEQNRCYIVVVMTTNSTIPEIVNLGTAIETAIVANDAN